MGLSDKFGSILSFICQIHTLEFIVMPEGLRKIEGQIDLMFKLVI